MFTRGALRYLPLKQKCFGAEKIVGARTDVGARQVSGAKAFVGAGFVLAPKVVLAPIIFWGPTFLKNRLSFGLGFGSSFYRSLNQHFDVWGFQIVVFA